MDGKLRGVGEGLPGSDPAVRVPRVLGLRGAALAAPENTLASLRAGLDLGLDGVQYDLRRCASGEPVLLRDETLSRTTDGAGFVRDRTLPELFRLDAGGWFSKSFVGEPLPLFDEALELEGAAGGAAPIHWVSLGDPDLVGPVSERVAALSGRLTLRVASASREVCVAAREAGLTPLYTPAEAASSQAMASALEFLRDERIAAVGFPAAAAAAADQIDWPCERWGVGIDAPEDLLAACRRPDFGLSTAEPQRALAVRELAALAPSDQGPYPLRVPALFVEEGAAVGAAGWGAGGGEWCGRWDAVSRLRNPFPFDVRVAVQLLVRRGAFEVDGLPLHARLAPGEELELPFSLSGGSWSPGGDPLLAALFEWSRGPGRPAGRLLLDAPLERLRTVVADVVTRRLRMLRESPGQAEATMTVRRRGGELLVAVENPGGLSDPHALVHFAGRLLRGGRGLRVPLPAGFDERPGAGTPAGLAFSCGFEGRAAAGGDGRAVLRRWAGGLPDACDAGVPGRLLPRASA